MHRIFRVTLSGMATKNLPFALFSGNSGYLLLCGFSFINEKQIMALHRQPVFDTPCVTKMVCDRCLEQGCFTHRICNATPRYIQRCQRRQVPQHFSSTICNVFAEAETGVYQSVTPNDGKEIMIMKYQFQMYIMSHDQEK